MHSQCDETPIMLAESESESAIPTVQSRVPRLGKIVGFVVLVVAALAVCMAAIRFTKHGGLIGTSSLGSPLELQEQDFLEFEPYYDRTSIPVDTYKAKAPFTGKIVENKRIVGPGAPEETCGIVIDHEGKMPYVEGQAIGVIPPGKREKDGKDHSVRLYNVASSRYGDDQTGNTMTLVVSRACEDPHPKGVCSNFLCDSKTGEEIKMTGPRGKEMLLPEEDPNTDIIMVATGTGVAPFRSFVRRIFIDKTPYGEHFKGLAWLFHGVANADSLLYEEEFASIKKVSPDHFSYVKALSREQTNKNGDKMKIQDKLEEHSDEIFDRMDNGAHIYFSGLKGMMPGIQEMLKNVAAGKGLDFDEVLTQWKERKQWHVEVY